MKQRIIFIYSLFFIFSLSNVFAEPLHELLQDKTRTTTSYFSIKPLDNWAYENVYWAPENFFGYNPSNAVELFPNKFDNFSMVNVVIAQDGHYTMKNAGLNHYVKYKMNDPKLVYLENSTLLSKENTTILNGTEAVKLTYVNNTASIDNQHKSVLYLFNHNKESYFAFFWSKINLFDEYLPEFQQILESIKWAD